MLRNFFYNSLYQIMAIILPFITAPYVSRVLGVEGVGIFSYTFSIAGYFVVFEMLGIKNYGSRTCAKVQNDKVKLGEAFVNIYFLQAIISIMVLITYILYCCFMAEYRVIALLQIMYVMSGSLDISWFFFGIEQFKTTAMRGIGVKVVSAICIFLFVKSIDDLWIYVVIISGSMLVSQTILWFYLKNQLIFCKPTWDNIKKHMLPNLVLFIPVIATSIYKLMDKIMIGFLSTMIQSGLYENSEKVINIPMTLITSLGTVMLPRMSNLVANNNENESRKLIRKSISFMILAGSAMVFGLVAVVEDFIPLFYGEEFGGCVQVVKILSPSILFVCWANVIRTQYLLPRNRDKSYIITVFLGAIVNFVINLFLIPQYGANGAAIGTLVAEAVVCITQSIFVCRELPILSYLKESIPYVIMGGIMFIMVSMVSSNVHCSKLVKIVLEIAVGGCVYLLLFIGLLWMQRKKKLTK